MAATATAKSLCNRPVLTVGVAMDVLVKLLKEILGLAV